MHQTNISQPPAFAELPLSEESQKLISQRTLEIKDLVRRTAQNLIEIGQKLLEVKQVLGHGSFGDWLKEEFNWSSSTAAKMMQASKQFKNVNFTDLNISLSAIYMLAAPSTPDSAREEALSRASTGESISYSLAKELVNRHKAPDLNQSQKLEAEPQSFATTIRERGNGSPPTGVDCDLSTQVLNVENLDMNRTLSELLQDFFAPCTSGPNSSSVEQSNFRDSLVREWSRMRRETKYLSIVLCVIDNLLVKDDELFNLREEMWKRQVRQTIELALKRSSDRFTYFKRGVFVLLLPSTNPEGATIIAENIQSEVESQRVKYDGADLNGSHHPFNLSFRIHSLIPYDSISSQMLLDELLAEKLLSK